ncbi:uncharacterized protein LOC116296245 [Actinia tenebrosa]|uniref:Uncharacterized protein LOC116296245 n=1 Tax=Actinia tenebrosa TaxID=6105 RepID=A0A6P8HXL8_ACTTE|nr:uncharacterized protein LOC116296245 [Actinia tenebrosa]
MSSNRRQVHFIRHAQSMFNKAHCAYSHGQAVDIKSPTLVDAGLSEEGKQQAINAKTKIKQLDIDLAITSPYARAISTCHLAHGFHNVLVTPLCGERFESVCDIGTPKEKLMKRFSELDFGSIKDNIWWFNPGRFEDQESVIKWYRSPQVDVENDTILKIRAKEFYDFLLARTEKNVAVFSHSHFLRKFLHWHFGRENSFIANAEVISFSLP